MSKTEKQPTIFGNLFRDERLDGADKRDAIATAYEALDYSDRVIIDRMVRDLIMGVKLHGPNVQLSESAARELLAKLGAYFVEKNITA